MKTLILLLISLMLTACDQGGSSPKPATVSTKPPTIVTIPPPTDTPPVVVTPPPDPPPPLTYDCTNHPATGKAYINSGNNYNIAFKADCTYSFADSSHITFGTWTPNPDPNAIKIINGVISYPMILTSTGAYQCYPLNGPQNCSNTGFVGNVLIQSSTSIPGTGLSIVPN